MRGWFGTSALLFSLFIIVASPCLAQSGQPLPRFGAGAKISTLGYGFEGATAVTSQSNVRGGVNFFNFEKAFSRNGIDYDGHLRLRSVEAHYDWFVGSAFHLSPGLLVYNANHVEGSAGVPAGRSFTLGGRTYTSNPANPVSGTGDFDFAEHKVSPMVTAGVGNLLRRSGRRWTITFEGGVVFEGSPEATLNLTGSACTGPFCQNVSTTPQIQADIRAEENKINNGTPPYDTLHTVIKYYPVISVGFGYRFK